MTIRALMKRRAEFNQLLAGNNNLSSGRYLRLMGLASVELCLGIPWGVYASLYLNLKSDGAGGSQVNPWVNWANVHYHFSFIGQFPAIAWKQDVTGATALELSRWSIVICSFIFFGFFGFAQEARKNYRLAFNSVAKKVGYTTIGFSSGLSSSFGGSRPPIMSSNGGRGTLPIYVRQETTSKRDSCASFSTNLTLGDVGGTLDDVKEPYSPSGSTSASSTYSREEKSSPSHPPDLPQPNAVFDITSPPRNSADAPKTARPDSNIIV
jgi:pheromone a factor receptor